MKRACLLMLSVVLVGACSSGSDPASTTYGWTATSQEASAVATAREMDGQAARVWEAYSDGLLLHYIYDFCEGLDAASDVGQYLDERAETQGEGVLLPLVVGSPYLCPERSDAVGDWISRQAASG